MQRPGRQDGGGMVDGETLAKGWIWIFTGVGAFFALRGMWRRRKGRQAEPPQRKEQ